MQMVKVQFKHPRRIGGKIYQRGLHSVPSEHLNHWFAQSEIKNGSMVLLVKPGSKIAQPVIVPPMDSTVDASADQGLSDSSDSSEDQSPDSDQSGEVVSENQSDSGDLPPADSSSDDEKDEVKSEQAAPFVGGSNKAGHRKNLPQSRNRRGK